MAPRGWTFIAALALIVVLYGLAALGPTIGLDASDRKQLVIYGNIVIVGAIGILGIPAIKGGNGKNDH